MHMNSTNATVPSDLTTALSNAAFSYVGLAEQCGAAIKDKEARLNDAYQRFPGGDDPAVADIERLKAEKARWLRHAAVAREGFHLVEDPSTDCEHGQFPELYRQALRQNRVRWDVKKD